MLEVVVVKEQQIQQQVELVVVELPQVQEHLDMELREQITLAVVVAVVERADQEQVEQEDRVSWSQEHQELQEFILQHVVHVHQLLLQMEQTKLQNLKHQQI
jgi:hypothetical protein